MGKFPIVTLIGFVLMMVGIISATNCGVVPVDGCIVTDDIVFEVGAYYLPSGISIGADGVVLDCNGATLFGEGSGNGIYNLRYDNIVIKNCNVKNYSNGIYLHYYYDSRERRGYSPDINVLWNNILEDNIVGLMSFGHSSRYPSKDNNISNNIFRNNNKGINFKRTVRSNIFNNSFKNNLEEGINFQDSVVGTNVFDNSFVNNSGQGVSLGGSSDSLIYNNIFSLTGIEYIATNNNKYCLDGELPNQYSYGAVGPYCDCLPLVDGLSITSSENICAETYYLPSGISIGADGVVLDCNGATLVGGGSGDGIYNLRYDNVVVENCNVENYLNGIYLQSYYHRTFGTYSPNFNVLWNNTFEKNGMGLIASGAVDNLPSSHHNISGNIFRDNTNGIDFTSSVTLSHISNNIFENNSDYGIRFRTSGVKDHILSGNFFISNNVHVLDSGVGNNWNNSESGNYWDDYDSEEEGCYDLNKDFICDDVYNIDGLSESKDYFPVLDSSCVGKINVYVSDSFGNLMDGVYVYLNEGDANVTSIDGFVGFDVEGECGVAQDVEVRCSDGVRICDIGSTIISSYGDVDTMSFICDVCRDSFDFWINENELMFENIDGDVRVNVRVHSLGLSDDVNVSLMKSCGGVKSLFESQNVSILEGESEVVSFVDDFEGCEKMDIMVEYFEEEDYFGNNVILDYPVMEPVRVYLEVDSGYSAVDDVIEEFVGKYVEVVSSKNDADLDIHVGKGFCLESRYCQDYLSGNLIRFEGHREGLPWNGLIVDGDQEIFVFGNEIDGLIVGVRRLVDERGIYLNKRNLQLDLNNVYLNSEDLDALSVYDFLHTDENVGVYRKDSEAFGDVVGNVLRRDVFNLEVKRVLTNDGVSLRIKNLASEFSEGFRNFVGVRPVVMSGGLFSNLETWENGGNGLATDLVREGKDVWEVEMTGGIGSECEGCDDYSYDDLVDSYWPALVGAVQYYSGAVGVDYVGHSNGCRVALSSLAKYQESGKEDVGTADGFDIDLEGSSSNPVVETFIGVACPAELNDGTFLSALTREVVFADGGHYLGDSAMKVLQMSHLTVDDYTGALYLASGEDSGFDMGNYIVFLGSMLGGKEKISWSLMEYYNDLSRDRESDFDLNGLEISKLRLYYGSLFLLGHDGVVPLEDMEVILDEVVCEDENTVKSGVSPGFPFDVDHVYVKNMLCRTTPRNF